MNSVVQLSELSKTLKTTNRLGVFVWVVVPAFKGRTTNQPPRSRH